MDTMLLMLRLGVASVFAVAGIAKLFDLDGSTTAAQDFGVPERLARLVGVGLPIAELAVAITLVPVATAQAGAIAGAVVMGAFIAGISVNLARGKRPDCHCFGKLHSAPIGWETVVRNGAITLAAALVAVAGPGLGLAAWLQGLDATSLALLGLLMVAVAAVAWQRQEAGQIEALATALETRVSAMEAFVNGEASDVPGPVPGTVAPDFTLTAIDRGPVSLDTLRALGKPVLLVFAEPTCSVCNTMMPKLGRYARDLRDSVTVAVIAGGGEAANRRKVDRYGLEWVLLPENRDHLVSYRVPGTPAGVLVAPDGIVAAPLAYGSDELLALFDRFGSATATTGTLRPVAA